MNKYDVKSHLCVKHLSETVHLHGRSPLCTSKCFAIWAFRILYIICQTQYIGMEVLHCVVKPLLFVNRLSHTAH